MTPLEFQFMVGENGIRDISAPEITPASPADLLETDQAGWQAIRDREQAAEQAASLPPQDPFAWGKTKEGQGRDARRQEVVQVASMRRTRAQAQKDQAALGGNRPTGEVFDEIEAPAKQNAPEPVPPKPPPVARPLPAQAPPVAQAAQRAAGGGRQDHARAERRAQRVAASRPAPAERARPLDADDHDARQQAKQARLQEIADGRDFPHNRSELPSPPKHDTLPPREHRDNDDAPLETFGRATVGFSNAVQREMAALSTSLVLLTRRVEGLECDRESEANA
jgi:hypothetical protein